MEEIFSEIDVPHASAEPIHGAEGSLNKYNETSETVNISDHLFSYYETKGKGIAQTTPTRSINIDEYCNIVEFNDQKGIHKKLTQAVKSRNENLIKQLKRQLDYITPSGVFSNRGMSGLIHHSGIFHVDIDQYVERETDGVNKLVQQISDPDDLDDKIKLLGADQNLNLILIHRSPTWTGIKAFFRVDIIDPLSHKRIFNAVSNYIKSTYDLDIDQNCSDVSRACFISGDINAKRIKDNDKNVLSEEFINSWANDILEKPVARNSPISIRMNKETRRKIESCISQLTERKIDITGTYDKWLHVGFSFAQFGESGRKYFHQVSMLYDNYNKIESDRKYDQIINDYDGSITIGTFFHFCKEHGIIPAERQKYIIESAMDSLRNTDEDEIPRQILGPLLFENEICIVFGKTNVGKSILGVQIGDILTKGIGLNNLVNEVEPQNVLYVDAEMSRPKFKKRYSHDSDRQNNYPFADNFIRMTDLRIREQDLIDRLEQEISQRDTNILIIDNLTKITRGEEKAEVASNLLERLDDLRNEYNLTILILAHTKKIDDCKVITENDLFGSSKIANLIDSSFAIGKTNRGETVRYIKQIKTRDCENQYGTDNVIVCSIVKADPVDQLRPI